MCLSNNASAQMYNNFTSYVDGELLSAYDANGEVVGQRIHAWAYTYAPSGTGVIHNYTATAKVGFPGGASVSQTATGSGFNAATANAFLDVPTDVIANNIEAEIEFRGEHKAFCPKNLGGTVPFAQSLTFLGSHLAWTTGTFTGVIIPGPGINFKRCEVIPACTNGTPACGTPKTNVQTRVANPCWPAYKMVFIHFHVNFKPAACSPGGAIAWLAPGFCTTY
jgi:hypothetical protein